MEFLIKVVKYLFELRIEILNVFFLLWISFWIVSALKGKSIRLIVAIALSVFFSLQLVSLYFVQTFIGYQFYVHFNVRDITGMLGIYGPQIVLLCFLFLALIMSLYHINSIAKWISQHLMRRISWSRRVPAKRHLFISILILGAYCMSVEKGMLRTSIELVGMLNTDNQDIDEALKKLGFDQYTFPEDVTASKAKNIIVLSLESLEKGYLDGTLSHLTPNLNELKKEWNYFNMTPSRGSEWTSASLYTSITGLPAYFGVHGNDIFQKAYHSNITGITHVLKEAGYDMTYISSSESEFSGIQELLYTYSLENIIDQSSLGKSFRDKDVFEEAKKQIKEYSSNEQPYMLFLSTVDTHFPNGIYDKRMEAYVSPKRNDLEFMVAALDYLVGDFVSYLKKEQLLENTVIYIYPDHLKMGSPISFDDVQKRSLYVLTNARKNLLQNTDSLYQSDIPNIILDGAEVVHNATFLSDIIVGDKNTYIRDHVQELISLNTAAVSRFNSETYVPKIVSKNFESYKKDTLRFIAHAGGVIDDLRYTNSLEALNKSYQNGFRLFELDIIETSDNKFVAAHDWEFWKDITNYKGSVPVTEQEFLNHQIRNRYTPLNMARINTWFDEHPDAILVTDKINDPTVFAATFTDKNRLMMELFDWDAVLEAIKANITPIVSQVVLENISGNKVKKLEDAGVRTAAVSRTFIKDNLDLLEALKSKNIKVYVYHINFSSDKDEQYVLKYEMDVVYGMYADFWDFSQD